MTKKSKKIKPSPRKTIVKDQYDPAYVVMLDAGHGVDTPGKRSPEGMLAEEGQVALFEWEFNRDIVSRIANKLAELGIQFNLVVETHKDIPLPVRTNYVNAYMQRYPRTKVILISVLANAASKPNTGTGFEAFTSPGYTEADKLAELFYKHAEKALSKKSVNVPVIKNGVLTDKLEMKEFEFEFREDLSDGDRDKEARFKMLVGTNCPAVLTENLFMDNETDLLFLLSEEGKDIIADYHVEAIKEYLKINEED